MKLKSLPSAAFEKIANYHLFLLLLLFFFFLLLQWLSSSLFISITESESKRGFYKDPTACNGVWSGEPIDITPRPPASCSRFAFSGRDSSHALHWLLRKPRLHRLLCFVQKTRHLFHFRGKWYFSFEDLDRWVVFETDSDSGFQLSGGFDPFLSYLAINYLDRFLSSSEIQVKMLIFCCFLICSCASKCLGTVFSWHVRLLRLCFFGFPALKRMQFSFAFRKERKVLWLIRIQDLKYFGRFCRRKSHGSFGFSLSPASPWLPRWRKQSFP